MQLPSCKLLPQSAEIGNSRCVGESRADESIKQSFALLFRKRKTNSTIKPSSYAILLRECSRQRFQEGGLLLHADMIKRGCDHHNQLQAQLFNLFIRCEYLGYARKILETSVSINTSLVSWNSVIAAYCRSGLEEEALSLFLELRRNGFQPDEFTLSIIIRVAELLEDLSFGRQLHLLSIKHGYDKEEFVGNSLIQMYSSFVNLTDSFLVFKRIMDSDSPVSWNSMIHQLVENGYHEDGIKLYKQMQESGIAPTPLTLSSVLKACAAVEAISEGRQIHAQAIFYAFLPNLILETSLVELYTKNVELENGRRVFERMEDRNAFSWNSLIRGYSLAGQKEAALKLFQEMRKEGIVSPDRFTLPALLLGAVHAGTLHEEFRSLHSYVIKVGLLMDPFVATSLIAMYSARRAYEESKMAFDDANSVDVGVWSSMITASMKNEEGEKALELFTEMLDLEIKPNRFIFSTLFTACGELSALEMGKQIHGYCSKSIEFSDNATQNSLINMYSNCGMIEEAVKAFDLIKKPNVISYNSVISALAQHGLPEKASEQFKRMKLHDLAPNEITILSLLTAFNHAGLVKEGLKLFSLMEDKYMIKATYQHHASIMDLLARAGEINDSIRFIDEMPLKPETSVWRIVLGACSKHQEIEIGKRVAKMLIEEEPLQAANYVLLANNYARVGKWIEAEKIKQMMNTRGLEKDAGFSWIEINRRIQRFGVQDKSHPLSKDIYKRLHELISKIKAAGYVPDISFTTVQDGGDDTREESLYYHSEKLAFAYGDLLTNEKVKLRIMKNIRVCGDCHQAYMHFSLITGREIVLRDNRRFHHFKNGICSCQDYW